MSANSYINLKFNLYRFKLHNQMIILGNYLNVQIL
jgi:hypothetical protein